MEIHKKVKYALLLVALIIGISGLSLADSEDGNITYTAKYKDAISYDITISGLGAPEENYDYYALICQEQDVTDSDFASVFGKSFSIEYDANDNTWKGNTLAAHDGVKSYGVFEKAGQYYGYIAKKPKVSATFEIIDGPTEVPMPELPPLGERININSSWASKTSCYIKVNAHNTMGYNGVQRTIRFYLGEVTDQNLLQELSEKGTAAYDKLLQYAKEQSVNLKEDSFKDTVSGLLDYNIAQNYPIENGKYYFLWTILDDEDGTYVKVEDVAIYNGEVSNSGKVGLNSFKYTPPQQGNTNTVGDTNQINQNTTNNDPTVANKQIPKAGFSVLGIIAIIIAIGAVVVFYIKNKEYKQVK